MLRLPGPEFDISAGCNFAMAQVLAAVGCERHHHPTSRVNKRLQPSASDAIMSRRV
jgi:hypothetical protein